MYIYTHVYGCSHGVVSNVQIRRPIGTVFELLLPALAVAALVGIR